LSLLEWPKIEEVCFGQNGMAGNSGRLFTPEWNVFVLEDVVYGMPGMACKKKVGFGPTQMTWNGGSRIWPDWNGL
jgi:hypothetical protein